MRNIIKLFAFLLLIWLPHTAWSAGPQSERWRTIRTEHFRVHYHEGVAAIADDVAKMCEAAHERLSPFFEYEPRLVVDVLLIDGSEAANGSATAFPNPRMTVYAVPPGAVDTRTDSDHWMWELILHEYVHILHLDQIHGWIRAINFPFGRQIMPNQNLPRWFTEGLATALESRETAGGRIRSNFYRMYLDAALVEGTLPTLGQLTNNPPKFPYANNWYLVGGNFVYWIGETYGWDKLALAAREQSRRLRPWAINYMALSAIGKTFDELYDEWKALALQEAEERLANAGSRGWTIPESVTTGGFHSKWISASPSGEHLWWLDFNGEDEARLISHADPANRTYRVRSASDFSIFPDGQSAVITISRPWRSGYYRSDLWRYEFASRRLSRLTYNARAQNPSVAPDGNRIAYLAPKDGRFDLRLLDLDTSEMSTIVEADPWTTIGQHAWSADGRFLYFSMSRIGGGRNLFRWDFENSELLRLTEGESIHESPFPTADGKWLYFSSDNEGIFNIYALNLEENSRELIRVTNVPYGVFAPRLVRADGTCLLYVSSFGAAGFDIASMPLSHDCSPPSNATAEPNSPIRPNSTALWGEIESDHRRYNAIMRAYPWSWSPIYEQSGNYRQLGFSTSGSDPAGVVTWAGGFTLGEPWNQVRWNGEVSYRGVTPDLRLRGGRYFYHRPRSLRRGDGWVAYDEIIDVYGASASFSVGSYRLTHSVSSGWLGEYRRMWKPVDLSHDPGSLRPISPQLGSVSSVYLSWSASNLRSYNRSISVERGWAMDATLRLRGPWTGADVRSRELSWGLAKAVPIHRWPKHAAVARLRGNHSASNWSGGRPYVLGGIWNQNVLDSLINQISLPTTVVRGYSPGIRSGANSLLLNAEYRFPIWWIDEGYSSLPLAFERLTGALFMDAGVAYQHVRGISDPLLGIGAELQLRIRMGYFLDQTLRAGMARGFGPDGEWTWYLGLGTGF